MKWLALFGIVAVMIGIIVLKQQYTRGTGSMNIEESKENPAGPSLYERIREQTTKSPSEPLDYENFPKIKEGQSGISFAPGLVDAVLEAPNSKNEDWKNVIDTIRAINRGEIKSWRVIENNIKGINVAAHVDNVLQHLSTVDITPSVKNLFWEVAKKSHEYEPIKWGVAIGGVFLTEEELPDLLVLARHGEFTAYTSDVLLRESQQNADYKKYLIDLLQVNRQWAVINLIEYIVADKELISSRANQEKVLIYGMENNDGIPMDVAFTIAKNIDVAYFLNNAAKDERVFSAVVDLFDTLLLDSGPLGGILDLKNGRSLFDQYFALVEGQEVDIEVLGAFRNIESFLDDKDLKWDSRERLLERARELYKKRLSSKIVQAGLREETNPWLALQIVKEEKFLELLPDVVEVFNRKPDTSAITVLGELGNNSHIELMMEKIPYIVDLESRKKQELSPAFIPGPDFTKTMVYAWIVKYLGKLATPKAVSQIKLAANDFHPLVRNAAMEAVSALPKDRIDDELKALIEKRLTEAPQNVRGSAKKDALKRKLLGP